MFDNIEALMKLRKIWSEFSSNHPRFAAFLNDAARNGFSEGTVLEIHLEYPDGRHISTNMRVTGKDLELFENVKAIASKAASKKQKN